MQIRTGIAKIVITFTQLQLLFESHRPNVLVTGSYTSCTEPNFPVVGRYLTLVTYLSNIMFLPGAFATIIPKSALVGFVHFVSKDHRGSLVPPYFLIRLGI